MSSADEKRATLAELFAGRYSIGDRLGWGGLALMYRATDPSGEELVLAVLPLDCETHPDNSRLFEEVFESVRSLERPGLVRLVTGGVQLGVPYFGYAYQPLTPLAERLASAPFGPRRAMEVAVRLLGVLEEVHRAGTFHGDLTPRNVLLGEEDEPRILGLGIAQLLRRVSPADVTGPTGRGSGKGAVRYLAPEVLGGATGDARGDLFSVGALLHRMVEGEPPGAGASRGFDAVPGLREVVERALAHDPEARFPSAQAMREALEGELAGAADDASAAPATPLWHAVPGESVASAGRRAWGPWLAVAALLGVGAVGAYVLRPDAPAEATAPEAARGRGAVDDEPEPASPPQAGSASHPASSPGAGAGEASVDEGAAETSVGEASVDEGAAEVSVGEASVGEGAAEVSVGEGAAEVSVGEGAVEASVGEGAVEASVGEGAVEASVGQGVEPSFAEAGPLAGPLPDVLRDALRRIAAGERFDDSDFDVLYAYTRANPRDLRGHLVLARAFMSRRWYTAALERYGHALRLDPAATEDPQVLGDLLTIVQRGDERIDPVWPNIRRFYGAGALPAVEARIDRSVRWDERRRLRRLASRLRRLAETDGR